MYHLGFDDLKLQSPVARFEPLRDSFVGRLTLLHTMIARQWRHNIRHWDYRNRARCKCGSFYTDKSAERAFILGKYTWCESYLHHIQAHGFVPPKRFVRAVFVVTSKRIPLSRLEKEVVNNSSKNNAR